MRLILVILTKGMCRSYLWFAIGARTRVVEINDSAEQSYKSLENILIGVHIDFQIRKRAIFEVRVGWHALVRRASAQELNIFK